MPLFSERYGYVKPSELIIREDMPKDVQNAICNALRELYENLNIYELRKYHGDQYIEIEKYWWAYYLNRKISDFPNGYSASIEISERYICSNELWYRKLDLIETMVEYMINNDLYRTYDDYQRACNQFIQRINSEFQRLMYAYRIIENQIVEINSAEEIQTIEQAIDEDDSNVTTHLKEALRLYSKRPNADARNSIKESISAVECLCRSFTNKGTLGDALNEMKKNGIIIHPRICDALNQLYAYTNQKDTGIRHALLEEEIGNTPTIDDAYFMLVTCSAFVNYIRMKSSAI